MSGDNNESIALKRVEKITNKPVKFYKCDLLDVDALEKIFTSHNFSSVIHFAAMKAVGESMQFPLLYYKNNLIGMINLLEVRPKLTLSIFIDRNRYFPYFVDFAENEKPQRFQSCLLEQLHRLR